VQRNYVHGKYTTPKSKKPRQVDLSRELRRALMELRDKRMLEAFMAGKAGVADDLVFPSTAGTPLDPNNLVHYQFQPCLERAGLRRFRFHDLRHTFGSLLIQDGASLAYMKDKMGHSSIQVTADTYGHLIPGANINWVDGLDRETTLQQNATPTQPAADDEHEAHVGSLQTIENGEDDGERGRNRTFNLLIKSTCGTKNQQFSSICTDYYSLSEIRDFRIRHNLELKTSKRPLGTKLGTHRS
jgi:Phage integrase family